MNIKKYHRNDTYDDYLLTNSYLLTNQCQTPRNNSKTSHHIRKTSQISTLSFKSKNKNKNYSTRSFSTVKKNLFSPQTIRIQHTLNSQNIHKKQNSQKLKKILTKKQSNYHQPKDKLKIKTQRKTKPIEIPQFRYLKVSQKSINQSGKQKKTQRQRTLKKTKKGEQLQIIMQRCEKIVNGYSQKLSQLKKQNELLKKQNQQLKTQNQMVYKSFVK